MEGRREIDVLLLRIFHGPFMQNMLEIVGFAISAKMRLRGLKNAMATPSM